VANKGVSNLHLNCPASVSGSGLYNIRLRLLKAAATLAPLSNLPPASLLRIYQVIIIPNGEAKY